MKTKKEIIDILRIMFPDGNQYMYEAVAGLILSDDTNCAPTKHFKYSDEMKRSIKNASDNRSTGLPAISATDRVIPQEFKPIDGITLSEFKFDPSKLDNGKKRYMEARTVSTPNFDGSKDPSLSKGLCSTVVYYDEDVSYEENLYHALNSKKHYDSCTIEYARDINNICYEIFNKYISVSNIGNILDASRQISIDKLGNALEANIKPISKSQEKILRDAVDALSPLVDEYCPWCSWMFILREYIKMLDRRKKNV